jgi:hypothetical protein
MKHTGVPLQEFTLFPNLPTELRLQIWKLSICFPEGRDLHFLSHAYHKGDDDSYYIFWQGLSRLRAFCAEDSFRDTTLFKINRESWEEASKIYRRVLGSLLPYWCPLRFDFERDTLKITYDTFVRAVFGLCIPCPPGPFSSPGRGRERPVISEKGHKELEEFVESLVHLNYSLPFAHSELESEYEVTSSLKSLRVFTVKIYGGPKDGRRPRCFDFLHRWIERSTKTRWIRTEESTQPVDPAITDPRYAPIKFKVVFENTRAPKTCEGAKRIDG